MVMWTFRWLVVMMSDRWWGGGVLWGGSSEVPECRTANERAKQGGTTHSAWTGVAARSGRSWPDWVLAGWALAGWVRDHGALPEIRRGDG